MSDFDAQRLLAIIDERVQQHLAAGLSYHHGVVATVNTSPQTCTVYLFGDTETSIGFRWSSECFPEAGDTVRVAINRKTGDRWVDAVVSRANMILPAEPDYPNGPYGLPSILEARRVNSVQTISTSTPTTVVFNSVYREDDEAGLLSHSTSNGKCTVAEAGWYQVDAGVQWLAGGTGNRRIYIHVNGNEYAAETHPATPNTNRGAISRRLRLSAGDAVSIVVWHDNGSNVDLNYVNSGDANDTRSTYLVVSYVRP